MRALGEDPAHFQKLVEGLWETYKPSDAAREGLVIRLARATWLQNRADRMQEGCAVRQAQDVSMGREDRLHLQMMRLKMTAESLLINRHIYPVSKKPGIPHFSCHSLRHTFSTLGGDEGTIPTLVMKQLLGHSKLGTSQKCMHELEGQQREAMSKIENLIWFPKKPADQGTNHNSTTVVAQCDPVATVATGQGFVCACFVLG
jgi:hypothetical protein